MLWLGYVALGLAAGVAGGLLGIGGAIIIVPTLVYFFGYGQHNAQGTSLATLLLPVGLLAVWRYYQAGYVNVPAAAVMAAAFLFGGFLGGQLAVGMSAVWLKRIFGALLLAVAVKMIWGK